MNIWRINKFQMGKFHYIWKYTVRVYRSGDTWMVLFTRSPSGPATYPIPWHAGLKKYRTHKFLPASPRAQMLQFQADLLQLQRITCHLAFPSDDRSQPFWHASNFFVDKMLGNLICGRVQSLGGR